MFRAASPHPRLFKPSFALVLLIAAVASGCVSSTRLVENQKVSAEVKAKNYSTYKQVLYIKPESDPRNVVPRVASELEAAGFKVRLIEANTPLEPAQGTGFVISADGYIVTCAHVLDEATEATVTLGGTRYAADVVKADKDADMALLKLRDKPAAPLAQLSFRGGSHDYKMGDDVFTIGYPLSRILGKNARMTKGLLSATSGLHDDPKQIQVSAEIQPGNSGGPLLDHDGLVIGIVQQTINPWRVAQATGGVLPQNINFSIKNEPVLDFLKTASPAVFAALKYDKGTGLDNAAAAVVKVQAGNAAEADQNDKIVVRLSYVSFWDLWYRFRLFVVAAFDYDTGESLFAAGQGRDNMVSDEEVVIKDTIAQFKKAVEAR